MAQEGEQVEPPVVVLQAPSLDDEGENCEAPITVLEHAGDKRPLDAIAAVPELPSSTPTAKKRKGEHKDVIVLLDEEDDLQVVVLDDAEDTGAPATEAAAHAGARTAPAALEKTAPRTATAAEELDKLKAQLAPASNGRNQLRFVDSAADIMQSMELQRLIRPPRYFDDDAGVPEPSTKRCFKCGQMGHFISSCTNAARQKPCYLCAQFGHEGWACPNRLCFRCGRPGHLSKTCTQGRAEGWESAAPVCNRCGATSTSMCACVGKGDYFRYEGGCTGRYAPEDLQHCRCYVCGRMGHLCCQKPPTEPPFNTSCYYCGSSQHLGEKWPLDLRPHLMAERAGDAKRAEALRQQELSALQQQQQQQQGERAGGLAQRSQSVDPSMWRGNSGPLSRLPSTTTSTTSMTPQPRQQHGLQDRRRDDDSRSRRYNDDDDSRSRRYNDDSRQRYNDSSRQQQPPPYAPLPSHPQAPPNLPVHTHPFQPPAPHSHPQQHPLQHQHQGPPPLPVPHNHLPPQPHPSNGRYSTPQPAMSLDRQGSSQQLPWHRNSSMPHPNPIHPAGGDRSKSAGPAMQRHHSSTHSGYGNDKVPWGAPPLQQHQQQQYYPFADSYAQQRREPTYAESDANRRQPPPNYPPLYNNGGGGGGGGGGPAVPPLPQPHLQPPHQHYQPPHQPPLQQHQLQQPSQGRYGEGAPAPWGLQPQQQQLPPQVQPPQPQQQYQPPPQPQYPLQYHQHPPPSSSAASYPQQQAPAPAKGGYREGARAQRQASTHMQGLARAEGAGYAHGWDPHHAGPMGAAPPNLNPPPRPYGMFSDQDYAAYGRPQQQHPYRR